MSNERDQLKIVVQEIIEKIESIKTYQARRDVLFKYTELVMGDYAGIRQAYHMEIWAAMREYLHVAKPVTSFQSRMRKAIATYWDQAAKSAWVDGGGEGLLSKEAQSWFTSRMEAEFGFTGEVFQRLKMLKAEDDFTMKDADNEANARAEGYARSLDQTYNMIKSFAANYDMLFLDGDDGLDTCSTCQRLKGQKHRAKWWVSRGYVPGPANNYECHGFRCRHALYYVKNGKRFTI